MTNKLERDITTQLTEQFGTGTATQITDPKTTAFLSSLPQAYSEYIPVSKVHCPVRLQPQPKSEQQHYPRGFQPLVQKVDMPHPTWLWMA